MPLGCGAARTPLHCEAAAVRLPLSPALPLREPPAPADLVLDRYSAAKVYLDGLCVEDEE